MMVGPMLTVLHPTDLSREEEPAFAHALRIAFAGESKLTLLHVDAPGEHVPWDEFPSVRAMLERWDLMQAGHPLAAVDEPSLNIEKIEAHGYDTVRAILRYLDDHPADLIVLATRGRDGFERWWKGSVAEPVARVSRTKSLFIPRGVPGFVDLHTGEVKLRRILVPVCTQPSHGPALLAARAFVTALGASECSIEACHVGDDEGDCPTLDDDVQLHRCQGAVADGLVDTANELDVDLVVMTTEGHNGPLDALRGSTTEQVLRRVNCPLLAVPAIGTD
jgi:nucleotide-binding universal stress UspA family protein